MPRPALALSPKAEEDNPDPSKLAPAAVIGWEELKERLVDQQNEMKKMAEYVAVGATGANQCVENSCPYPRESRLARHCRQSEDEPLVEFCLLVSGR